MFWQFITWLLRCIVNIRETVGYIKWRVFTKDRKFALTFFELKHAPYKIFTSYNLELRRSFVDSEIRDLLDHMEDGKFWNMMPEIRFDLPGVLDWDGDKVHRFNPRAQTFTTMVLLQTDFHLNASTFKNKHINEIIVLINAFIYEYLNIASPHLRREFMELGEDRLLSNLHMKKYRFFFDLAMKYPPMC